MRPWLKRCVDKLMDGTVDKLMDNSASCPQLATQAAHELIHDGLFNCNNNFFISYLSTITVLTEESTSKFKGLVERRNHKWGWLETTSS